MKLRLLALMFLMSVSTMIQASAPCNFDRRATDLYNKIILKTQPAPGFSVVVSSEFDKWLSLAPQLNPLREDFHEGNAYFWQMQFLKTYTAALLTISSQMRSVISQLKSTEARSTLGRLEAFEPTSAIDTFVKRYTITAVRSADLFRNLASRAIALCPRDDSKIADQHSRTKLAEYASEMRVLLYQPLLPWTPDLANYKLTDDPRFLNRLIYETTVFLSKTGQ